MKTDPGALGIAVNGFESAKHEICPNALGTAKNWSCSAKHENCTRCPRYCRNESESAKHEIGPASSIPPKMSQRAQNMKTGKDVLDTVENGSGNTKLEN
jgi:hypothetical protein